MANSDRVLCLVLLQLALSTRHKCDESLLLPSLLRGEWAGRKADGLDGCRTSLPLISTLPVSRSSGAFWLRAGHWATGSQSVNKALCCRPPLQLSGEKVCVCFPCVCQRLVQEGGVSGPQKGRRTDWMNHKYSRCLCHHMKTGTVSATSSTDRAAFLHEKLHFPEQSVMAVTVV